MSKKSMLHDFKGRQLSWPIALITICLLGAACSLIQNPKRVNELREIAAGTPVFPGFVLVSSHDGGKAENAIVARFYRSNATYEQVKEFYRGALTAKSWGEPKEESLSTWGIRNGGKALTFKKGEYKIAIEYSSESDNWQFSIIHVWEAR